MGLESSSRSGGLVRPRMGECFHEEGSFQSNRYISFIRAILSANHWNIQRTLLSLPRWCLPNGLPCWCARLESCPSSSKEWKITSSPVRCSPHSGWLVSSPTRPAWAMVWICTRWSPHGGCVQFHSWSVWWSIAKCKSWPCDATRADGPRRSSTTKHCYCHIIIITHTHSSFPLVVHRIKVFSSVIYRMIVNC